MSISCPGFIDLQVNGYLGYDFADVNEEHWQKACDGVLASGTAAFLPTLVTAPMEDYKQVLPRLANFAQQKQYHKRIIGLHLEGPFLSNQPGAVGAHNPAFCQEADCTKLDQLQEWADGQIRLLTIAANIPGAAKLCRHAVDLGITVANGHSLATEDDLRAFADAGGTGLTHLGNALPNEINRFANPLWSGLCEDQLSAMVITDGHHVSQSLQKIIYRCKGIDQFIVVSDASPIAGMPPGIYEALGNKSVLEENGKLHNPDKQCLVGSSAMMFECMNQLANLDLMSTSNLLRAGIENPRTFINVPADEVFSEPMLSYDEEKRQFKLL